MEKIALEDLQPGMVTAAPVEDARGRLLVPAGEVLQECVIDALSSRGITSVYVAEADAAESPDVPLANPQISEADQARLLAGLESRFASYGDVEPYETIKAVARDYLFVAGRRH